MAEATVKAHVSGSGQAGLANWVQAGLLEQQTGQVPGRSVREQRNTAGRQYLLDHDRAACTGLSACGGQGASSSTTLVPPPGRDSHCHFSSRRSSPSCNTWIVDRQYPLDVSPLSLRWT